MQEQINCMWSCLVLIYNFFCFKVILEIVCGVARGYTPAELILITNVILLYQVALAETCILKQACISFHSELLFHKSNSI